MPASTQSHEARQTPRLVLDTNVCLDLLLFADPRSDRLRAALDARRFHAITNAECRAEWRRVLRYPALRLDAARCVELDARYDALMRDCECPPVDDGRTPPPRCADPDDQKFLELAHASHACALLTRDAELLRLARRTQREGRFAILTPETFDPASREQSGQYPAGR